MSRVVFLLAPRLHLLDLAGPAQVFSTAADYGYGYTLHYVAEQEDITTHQGVPLTATTEWPDLAAEDIVVVPGWRWPERGWSRPARGRDAAFTAGTLRRLVAHHDAGGTVASVCSGAFALGRAGLLDHRRCTTHHELQDDLAAWFRRSIVVRDVLYVADGRVVTSAGIASGIDLALHLIAGRHGPAVAARCARQMIVYARRNGDEQQASAMLRYRSHVSDIVHRVQDHIDERFAERLPVATLAAEAAISDRTLTRLFTNSIGLTPLRYQQTLRLERAEHLISQGATVESAARAVGFEDARMLRRLRARSGRPGHVPARHVPAPNVPAPNVPAPNVPARHVTAGPAVSSQVVDASTRGENDGIGA